MKGMGSEPAMAGPFSVQLEVVYHKNAGNAHASQEKTEFLNTSGRLTLTSRGNHTEPHDLWNEDPSSHGCGCLGEEGGAPSGCSRYGAGRAT